MYSFSRCDARLLCRLPAPPDPTFACACDALTAARPALLPFPAPSSLLPKTMLSIASAAYAFAPVTPKAAPSVSRAAAPVMETKADLEALAVKLNPVVGFWDPMCAPQPALAQQTGRLHAACSQTYCPAA